MDSAGEKQCPYCAETIKAAAIKCRFCQSDLTGTEATDGATEGAPPAPPAPSPPAHDQGPEVKDHDDVASTPATASADPSGTPFLASKRLFLALVVLCLVLAGVVGYAWWAADSSEGGSPSERVITSSQARDAGLAAAAELTEKVLAYNWKTLDKDMQEAEAVLAPTFRAEYAKAMAGVKSQTVENQVTLTAKVTASSIVSASERKVEALVFVNQVTTAKGSKNERVDQNRVLVTLTRGGGEWRVSKMKAF